MLSALTISGYVITEVIHEGLNTRDTIKIFDPFFTTKPVAQETGLGLSISHLIVQKHHIQLVCLSELGVGTEFTILLPY